MHFIKGPLPWFEKSLQYARDPSLQQILSGEILSMKNEMYEKR